MCVFKQTECSVVNMLLEGVPGSSCSARGRLSALLHYGLGREYEGFSVLTTSIRIFTIMVLINGTEKISGEACLS